MILISIFVYLFIGSFISGLRDEAPFMDTVEFFLFITTWPFLLVYAAGYKAKEVITSRQ